MLPLSESVTTTHHAQLKRARVAGDLDAEPSRKRRKPSVPSEIAVSVITYAF